MVRVLACKREVRIQILRQKKIQFEIKSTLFGRKLTGLGLEWRKDTATKSIKNTHTKNKNIKKKCDISDAEGDKMNLTQIKLYFVLSDHRAKHSML